MRGSNCPFLLDFYQLSPASLLTFLHPETGYWGVHTPSKRAVLLGPSPPLTGRHVDTVLAEPPVFRRRQVSYVCTTWPYLKTGIEIFKSLSGQTGGQVMDHQPQDISRSTARSGMALAFPSTTSGDLL